MGATDDHDTARDAATESTPQRALGEPDDLDGLRRERDIAVARVRELEHELGALRGKVKRLELMMWRRTARRQRLVARATRARSMADRFVHRGAGHHGRDAS